MLTVYVIGAPLAARYVEYAALSGFDPATLSDSPQRSAALRDIRMVASGQAATTPPVHIETAARALNSAQTLTSWLLMVFGGLAGVLALVLARHRIGPEFRARNNFELFVKVVLFACSAVAVLTTIGIVFSVLFETIRFFGKVSPFDFLFGLQWSPQTAIRADQVGSSGAFGIVPLVAGTLLITLIAMLIAGPIGLLSAIFMAEYASPRLRALAKPVLEILAGIPTVVLGFFAALTVAPLIRGWGEALGLTVASESALAAGIVMGMMIIPFVSSLSDDVINAVPQSLRDGSYAMGATQSETIRRVVLPAALPGIVSAFMLAISRAVGETMIVVMAAGLAANLTFNPLEAVTTFTVQIKTILVGDQEFDSAKTLSAFALGFVLFFFTLALNFIALRIVQRYREQYE
jgi:phosphate transport system permease protein